MRLLLAFTMLLLTSPAYAALVSDWDISMGMISMKYSHRDLSDTLESSTALEVNYSIYQSAMDTAFTLTFMEVAGGGGHSLPYTRISMGARYYLMGINGLRTILDSRSEMRVWKASPFVAMNLGIGSLTVKTDEEGGGFNASLVDLNFRGGVEIPLGSDLLLIGQISVGSSMTSSKVEDESVNYNFVSLLAGIRFVGF